MVEKISQKIVDKVNQLLKKDVDHEVIAKVLDLSLETVIHVSEGKYTTWHVDEEDIKKIHQLWMEKLEIKTIASETGWSISTITKVLSDVRKPQNRKSISEEEAEKMKKLYCEGKTVTEIANLLGRQYQVVSKYLSDLTPPAKRLTKLEKEEIIQMYQDGKAIQQIAKEFHVHQSTIYRVVQKYK